MQMLPPVPALARLQGSNHARLQGSTHARLHAGMARRADACMDACEAAFLGATAGLSHSLQAAGSAPGTMSPPDVHRPCINANAGMWSLDLFVNWLIVPTHARPFAAARRQRRAQQALQRLRRIGLSRALYLVVAGR